MSQIQRKKTSSKADLFTESVIREMTRVALQHGAINLSQGFPDFPCPIELKQAAYEAIAEDVNQYAITGAIVRFGRRSPKKFAGI